MSDDKVCFVIAPIGGEGTDTRERSNTVFTEVIKEVVDEFDYECKRADHIEEPGSITNQVIEYVVKSELVIADLTDKNPNVFYELAVRHAHHKPVIQLINDNQDIPFDVATQRTISINLDDFATTRRAQEKIRNQIREIESDDFEVENPVSVAGHIRELRESGNPEKQQLAELTELLNEINSKIRTLEKDMQDPEKLLPPEYIQEIQDQLSRRQIEMARREIERIDREMEDFYADISDDPMIDEKLKERIKNIGMKIQQLRDKMAHNSTLDEF